MPKRWLDMLDEEGESDGYRMRFRALTGVMLAVYPNSKPADPANTLTVEQVYEPLQEHGVEEPFKLPDIA